MAFTNNYRMERVYFERLKSMIDVLKSWLETETDEKTKSILENGIDDNGAILLLYRNLGEAWAELSDLIKKADEKIDDLNEKTDEYHDELNERIDEVNNYIMGLLRELFARLEAVEQDLSIMSRVKFLDLVEENNEYSLLAGDTPVTFESLSEMMEFPHYVIIRGNVNGEQTYFIPREADADDQSGLYEFYATGLVNNVVHELTVTVLPDDSVNVATDIQEIPVYTAGNGIVINNNNEISVDTTVIQEKLTEGFGIDIDSNNEISVDTNEVQEKLIAGNNITLTPDTMDPTKTVISGNGGSLFPYFYPHSTTHKNTTLFNEKYALTSVNVSKESNSIITYTTYKNFNVTGYDNYTQINLDVFQSGSGWGQTPSIDSMEGMITMLSNISFTVLATEGETILYVNLPTLYGRIKNTASGGIGAEIFSEPLTGRKAISLDISSLKDKEILSISCIIESRIIIQGENTNLSQTNLNSMVMSLFNNQHVRGRVSY